MNDIEQGPKSARDYLTDQLGIAAEDGDDANFVRDVGNALADVIEMERELDSYTDEGVYVVAGGGVYKFWRSDFANGSPLTKIAALTDEWETRSAETA